MMPVSRYIFLIALALVVLFLMGRALFLGAHVYRRVRRHETIPLREQRAYLQALTVAIVVLVGSLIGLGLYLVQG